VEEAEGRRPLGNIDAGKRIILRDAGWGGMSWFDLAEDRDVWRTLVNMVIYNRVPENNGNFLSSYATGGFPRKTQLHGVS
jgi:hypothetical protein